MSTGTYRQRYPRTRSDSAQQILDLSRRIRSRDESPKHRSNVQDGIKSERNRTQARHRFFSRSTRSSSSSSRRSCSTHANLGQPVIERHPLHSKICCSSSVRTVCSFSFISSRSDVAIAFYSTLAVEVSAQPPDRDAPLVPPPETEYQIDRRKPVYLFFSVEDTGPGMTQEETQKLFKKFMQCVSVPYSL